jgi:phospholipid N-methyltransferase
VGAVTVMAAAFAHAAALGAVLPSPAWLCAAVAVVIAAPAA